MWIEEAFSFGVDVLARDLVLIPSLGKVNK